jgi:hypothetical protein
LYQPERKNRQAQLFRDSVIAPAEFDVYENSLKLAEINAQVANDQLVALSTGEKATVVDLSAQKILSYDSEIERLENQKAQYTITTPIRGILSYDTEIGGIIKVSDIDRLLLKIPVTYQNSSYLHNLYNKITVNATFKGFDENINLIQSQQFVIARAVTAEATPGIYPGMVVQCRIYCDKVNLLEYLKRNFSVSF